MGYLHRKGSGTTVGEGMERFEETDVGGLLGQCLLDVTGQLLSGTQRLSLPEQDVHKIKIKISTDLERRAHEAPNPQLRSLQ